MLLIWNTKDINTSMKGFFVAVKYCITSLYFVEDVVNVFKQKSLLILPLEEL